MTAFSLPHSFFRLHEDGCCDPHNEMHIQFTDMLWLTPEQMENWTFDKRSIDGFIPFAQTLNHDCWCFAPHIDSNAPAPVAFCPEEDEVAVLYAPDFASFLYRMMLDEMASTYLVARESFAEASYLIRNYALQVCTYLPTAWAERLTDLAERQLCETDDVNFYGMLSQDELEQIIAEDISYDRLDEEFEHILPE